MTPGRWYCPACGTKVTQATWAYIRQSIAANLPARCFDSECEGWTPDA